MNPKIIEFTGWIGVIAILSAYTLSTLAIIEPSSQAYLMLNLFGGIAIVFSAARKKDYQPVVLNIIWTIVAVMGIVRSLVN